MLKKLIYTLIVAVISFSSGIAQADSVPVVNAYQYESGDNTNNNSETINTDDQQDQSYLQAPQPHLSTSQRLSRLEQQMSNQQLMDIPGQIQQLEQQIEKLQGQLQEQSHELEILKTRLTTKNSNSLNTNQVNTDTSTTAQTADTTTATAASASVITTTPAATTTTNNNFLTDQSTYQAAYNLIAASKYPEAISALNNYLQQFPKGQYVSNAYYWLGELYLLQNNEAAAITNFQTVISQYPSSNKYPDAMLKLGLIYYDNGQLNKAKVQLQKVIKLYPNTTVANLASARLLDINQQTNTQSSNTSQATTAPAATTETPTTETQATTGPAATPAPTSN